MNAHPTNNNDEELDKILEKYGAYFSCNDIECAGKTHHHKCAGEAKTALRRYAQKMILAELKKLKQGHIRPLSEGNAEILLHAIADRITNLESEIEG